MKRLIIILLALMLKLLPASSQEAARRFHCGVEWGMNYAMYSLTYCTFLTDERYVVESHDARYNSHFNGFVTGMAGYDISQRFGLYALTGYMGVLAKENVVPVTIRGVWTLGKSALQNSVSANSVYFEAGCGFRYETRPAILSRLGYIYKIRLMRNMSLGINGGFMASLSHPEVYDKYSDKIVERDDLGISNSLNFGFSCGLSLMF